MVRRAKQVAARKASKPRSGAWSHKGKGALKGFVTGMIEPQCYLGPHELCVTLRELVIGCDDGDADDCMAVGQFLADAPPRMLIANTFFHQACRIGDPAGCARLDDLLRTAVVPCEEDPFACGWRAFRTGDLKLHDEACSLGAAESCTWLAHKTTNLEQARAYLETACQLGNPLGCAALALQLSPSCEGQDDIPCFEVDEREANAARDMACAGGWNFGDICDQ